MVREKVRGFLRRHFRWAALIGEPYYRYSFSQFGEDLLIETALSALGVRQPSYLDIGANDPVVLSNTYLFYKRGGRGVCVEPDPFLASRIRRRRRRDTCLAVGVGAGSEDAADFFVMSIKDLNTFSKTQAELLEKEGIKIEKVLPVPLQPINDIIAQHFPQAPDLLSLDVEGFDERVLSSMDFHKFRPKVICVETLVHGDEKAEQKDYGIARLLQRHEYFRFADTRVNTIFVDQCAWKERNSISEDTAKRRPAAILAKAPPRTGIMEHVGC